MQKFRGTVLVSDIPNKNNRIYSKKLLSKIVDEFQDKVNKRMIMGQMDYPQGCAVIHYTNASHVVTELTMEGNNMVATIETINTPCGNILETMIEDNSIALRPFGVGDVTPDNNGNYVIGDDYKLVSISAVKATNAA